MLPASIIIAGKVLIAVSIVYSDKNLSSRNNLKTSFSGRRSCTAFKWRCASGRLG